MRAREHAAHTAGCIRTGCVHTVHAHTACAAYTLRKVFGAVQVGLTETVPFLLEAKMKELGCDYVPGEPWSETAVRDGKLCTGQNPQSSVKTAKLCLEALA